MSVQEIQAHTKTGLERILRVLDGYIKHYEVAVVSHAERFEREVRGWYRTLVGDILLDRLYEAEQSNMPAPPLRDLA